MEPRIKIYSEPMKVAEELAMELFLRIKIFTDKGKTYCIALSGGETPYPFFTIIANKYSRAIKWEYVHLFWGDERCVPPNDSDSNYGRAKKLFLDMIEIPKKNIHRIRGEDEPIKETKRYSNEIKAFTKTKNGLPSLDFTVLGIGEDGHTASLYPNQLKLIDSPQICEMSINPQTLQKRITLTGTLLNNSGTVAFFVTGKNKANIVSKILNNESGKNKYPASYISPKSGKILWYLDEAAASKLVDLKIKKF